MKESPTRRHLSGAPLAAVLGTLLATLAGCGGADDSTADEEDVAAREDGYCVCYTYPCEPCGECGPDEESCRYSCDSPPACVPAGQCWASVDCPW